MTVLPSLPICVYRGDGVAFLGPSAGAWYNLGTFNACPWEQFMVQTSRMIFQYFSLLGFSKGENPGLLPGDQIKSTIS